MIVSEKGSNPNRPKHSGGRSESDWTPLLRCGFTLVELLVTIAIIGIIVGLLAPSLQAMRETARRSTCQSNLAAISMAIQSYHDRWQHFPVGTVNETKPIKSEAVGGHHNWLGRLLDLLDQPVIASNLDRTVGVYDEKNREVLQLRYPGVKCPSARPNPENASNYVGFHHGVEKPIDETDHGVFLLNERIDRDDVVDGLSNTAFVSEKTLQSGDLGWLSGTRATLRNVGGGIESSTSTTSTTSTTAPQSALAVGSIGSRHPAGVHVLFGSGAIRFQSTQTDPRILEQMVDRRDGQLPMHFQSIDELRRQSLK